MANTKNFKVGELRVHRDLEGEDKVEHDLHRVECDRGALVGADDGVRCQDRWVGREPAGGEGGEEGDERREAEEDRQGAEGAHAGHEGDDNEAPEERKEAKGDTDGEGVADGHGGVGEQALVGRQGQAVEDHGEGVGDEDGRNEEVVGGPRGRGGSTAAGRTTGHSF